MAETEKSPQHINTAHTKITFLNLFMISLLE
jgi:hypothetical protein